ncbi:MAG: glycosyltransferase [Alphaproteobacteria bacterium]|nr:MAG: glycosyltransferase [Alphaproteobacteria bacterium]
MAAFSSPSSPVVSPPAASADAVIAVVVSYNTGAGITQVVQAALAECSRVIVVDNGSDAETLAAIDDAGGAGAVHVIRNPDNRGLAPAQNQGIAAALAAGATAVLLLDHDSVVQPGLVAALGAALANGAAVAAPDLDLGPNGRRTTFLPADHRWRVRRVAAQDLAGRPVAFAIASGSLIPRQTLARVGLMRDAFAIDYVDIDFCLRVIAAGGRVEVVPTARLHHRLGDPGRRAGVRVTNHSVGRRFTIWRNRVVLWREWAGRMPGWVVSDMAAGAVDLVRILWAEQNRLAKLAAAWRGLIAGLVRRPAAAPALDQTPAA